jgi:hypothetical protein
VIGSLGNIANDRNNQPLVNPWKSLRKENEGVVTSNVEEMAERNTSILEYWLEGS